jgi:hypothetical protein
MAGRYAEYAVDDDEAKSMIEWEIQNDWSGMLLSEKAGRVCEIALSDAALLIYAALILYFFGGLSLRATLAIMIVFGLFWLWHRHCMKVVSAIHELTSKPYELKVHFKLGEMLNALNISLDGIEMPKSHSECLGELLLAPRYGIRAVVLKSNQGSDLLIHWLNTNSYSTKLHYGRKLDFVKIPYVKPNVIFDSWSPMIFLTQDILPEFYEAKKREDRDACIGYGIGISVDDNWWNENKNSLQSTSFKNIEPNWLHTGMTRITFAVLPQAAFSLIDCKRLKEREMKNIRDYSAKVVTAAGWKATHGWNPGSGSSEGISPDGQAEFVCEYADVELTLV